MNEENKIINAAPDTVSIGETAGVEAESSIGNSQECTAAGFLEEFRVAWAEGFTTRIQTTQET